MVRRVYFDTSALNRPFDDQTQARIRLETEAVEHLLRAVGERMLEWISSDIVLFDDSFIQAARALQPASPVRVENPVIFELEDFQ